MNTKDFHIFIKDNKKLIEKIAWKIFSNNPEYTLDDIKDMVTTSIFELEKPTEIAIYYKTLHRVLGEKGYKIYNNEIVKLEIPIEEIDRLEPSEGYNDFINKPDYTFVIDSLFSQANLTQDETFVIALCNGLSTPCALKGKYKKILDNIDHIYYTRALTQKEICSITKFPPRKLKKINKKAMKKLEKYSAII